MATFSEQINVKRIASQDRPAAGKALVAGDFAISAGFGDSATISSVAGTDSAFKITVASAGSGQAFQPTVTLTWADGAWRKDDGSTYSPFIVCSRSGGSQNSVEFNATASATFGTLTFTGTASSGETYSVTCFVRG